MRLPLPSPRSAAGDDSRWAVRRSTDPPALTSQSWNRRAGLFTALSARKGQPSPARHTVTDAGAAPDRPLQPSRPIRRASLKRSCLLNVLGRRPQRDASDVAPRPASENVECTKRGMTFALWGIGRCDRCRRRRRRAIRRRQARPLGAKGRCKRREGGARQCAERQSTARTKHQHAFKQRGLATALLTRSFSGTARALHELSIPTQGAR